jgi:hypothetical protein
LDHTPAYAFGIKHSPYMGQLKGDAWVSPRTEVDSPPLKALTNGESSASTESRVVSQTKGNTTTTTRTHSDGTKIRTETYTYTKGPTTTTRVTSHKNYKSEQTAIA